MSTGPISQYKKKCPLLRAKQTARVMFIPGVLSNLPLYLLSIVIGTGVTAGMLFVLKRPIALELMHG